jgi:PAS domain S-box-containing protein
MFAAWYGGRGPGLLATLLSAVLANFFFISPIGSFGFDHPADAFALGLFVVTGTGITLLAHSLRSAKRIAEGAARQKAEILESIQDGFVGVDREFHLTFANPAAEALLETPLRNLIGRRFNQVCAEWPVSTAITDCSRAPAERKLMRFECFNPTVGKWFDFSAYPATDGLAIYFRDITERKRNEQVLAQFASIVESSDDAIISADLSGSVLTWNSAAERMFGYSAQEIVGRSINLLSPPDRPQEQLWISEKVRRGESLQHFETIRIRKDGEPIHISLTVSPIRDTSGALVATSRVERDITEVKALEDQLRHSAKLESLGVLAGGIAHDFNNLLTGILGNASLASEMLLAGSPARTRIDDVIRAGERAADLVRRCGVKPPAQ